MLGLIGGKSHLIVLSLPMETFHAKGAGSPPGLRREAPRRLRRRQRRTPKMSFSKLLPLDHMATIVARCHFHFIAPDRHYRRVCAVAISFRVRSIKQIPELGASDTS